MEMLEKHPASGSAVSNMPLPLLALRAALEAQELLDQRNYGKEGLSALLKKVSTATKSSTGEYESVRSRFSPSEIQVFGRALGEGRLSSTRDVLEAMTGFVTDLEHALDADREALERVITSSRNLSKELSYIRQARVRKNRSYHSPST